MRFAMPAALTLAANPGLAFEPGTHGAPMEETGYFVACNTGERGSACDIHERGAVFMANYLISMGPSCADGVDRGSLHFSLYQMVGDPFASICLELVSRDAERLGFRDVANREDVVLIQDRQAVGHVAYCF